MTSADNVHFPANVARFLILQMLPLHPSPCVYGDAQPFHFYSDARAARYITKQHSRLYSATTCIEDTIATWRSGRMTPLQTCPLEPAAVLRRSHVALQAATTLAAVTKANALGKRADVSALVAVSGQVVCCGAQCCRTCHENKHAQDLCADNVCKALAPARASTGGCCRRGRRPRAASAPAGAASTASPRGTAASRPPPASPSAAPAAPAEGIIRNQFGSHKELQVV